MPRRAKSIIRYDGPALAGHEMDVHQLAPALLALGDLCKTANATFNPELASIKVMIRADIEQQRFQLQLELVQTLFDRLTTVLEADVIQDAKNILEWIGIIAAGGSIAVGGGLFGLYKYLSKKSPDDEIGVSLSDANGNVTYQIIGDSNTLVVPQQVDQLAQDPRALKAVQAILAPLSEDGYETLEFERNGTRETHFSRAEAKQILNLQPDDLIIHRDGEMVSTIRTTVKVRKAIHEGDAAWGVNYKRAVEAKMLDREWLDDFQRGHINLPVGSRLVVELREIVPVDENRIEQGPARYEILNVIGVELPPEQYKLID